MRNRDIGAELNIGEGTVKVYLHAMYQKLGIENRTELALMAVNDLTD
jgi:two-component system nitrate/nitrite response regulator NarP